MEGPAHKKALAKEKAQKERESWMGNPSAAANALVIPSPPSHHLAYITMLNKP
jgi:hypothetical protein